MAMAVLGRSARPTERDTTGATRPRSYVFDDLFVKRYDETILDGPGGRPPSTAWNRVVPPWARIAAEVQRRRDEYDVIVTWSERVSLSLMTLQRLASEGKPHVALLYWFSRPSVQIPLRAFADALQAIVTWSSVQRTYAIERLGIPHEKLYLIKHFVDQLFWSPREREPDMICSAGAEMRDYPTLLRALRGTDLRCHIAADHVRVDRFGFARRLSTAAFSAMASGSKVTIGRKPLVELRELYARSRFVVVPLQTSDTDNGITVILEAMAMGKPVICSRTRGQVDVIQEGVTGLFVPVGDAKAMRTAILDLWHDPARAERMGRAARAYVEKHHTLEQFSQSVKGAVDASLEGRTAARDGSFMGCAPAAGTAHP
jgi:glycosyltransferase involved in cell wall biosynthesis